MEYRGKYIDGRGDNDWLLLIDRSCEMLHASENLPCLPMLYRSKNNMFSEGFIWDGWWIQNSYGFALGAVPFLPPHWRKVFANSYDAFWARMGDGKRSGRDDGEKDTHACLNLTAPDGALGDCVFDCGIVYKQGDGDIDRYDWFYEATAAGVLLQCEQLLFSRDLEAIRRYLPLMRRAIAHIESTRDESGLFLVGPSCNLLAPSFGAAWNAETGEIEKSYLTGLAVTFAAALSRYLDVLEIAGEKDTDEYKTLSAKLELTPAALETCKTPEGYFAKSVEKNGVMHGVYGQARYGYLEGVCNVDAVAHGVANKETSEKILDKIASVEGIRPNKVLCCNYPHLDDTYKSYLMGSDAPDSLGWTSGDWVDGGCWATVEGRAILAYLKNGRYRDAFDAASVYMDWALSYRQDAPLSQWGFNTSNPWANEKEKDGDLSACRPVAVMVDNFAPVTCLLRGLLDIQAKADGLYLTAHIPDGIEEISFKQPVYYADCEITVEYAGYNGTVFIPAAACKHKKIHVMMNRETFGYSMTGEYKESVSEAFAAELEAFREAAKKRKELPFTDSSLRPVTEEKVNAIWKLYDDCLEEMERGGGSLTGKMSK